MFNDKTDGCIKVVLKPHHQQSGQAGSAVATGVDTTPADPALSGLPDAAGRSGRSSKS